MESKLIALFDIAQKDIYDENSDLKVPNIQRGLVWKSIQMELLWDSILRGFPIGSMLVLENDENTQELLDGQQRANAIITGFNISELLSLEKKPKAILWLDLAHKENDSDPERRKYGIRLTNASHPWGFDYSGNKLTASERREALRDAYGESYSPHKADWDIRHFVPLKHNEPFLPVPLALFVSAAFNAGDSFDDNLFLEKIKTGIISFSNISNQWKNRYRNSVIHFIEENKDFIEPFRQLKNYAIVFNSVTTADDIEILFNRVNSRGTQMSGSELTYAAIKHYGAKLCNCPNIGQIIKENAKGIMMEHILAQIIFRYCFSENSIHGEINAGQIRKQALVLETNKVSKKLSSFFCNKGEKLTDILRKTKEILLSSPDNDNLPTFLMAEIANNNPNLFILLFCLIDKHNLDSKFVQALVFFLYCFSKNNEPIRLIFEIVSQRESVDIKTIQDILRDSISREWCYPLVPSFENFPALQESEYTHTWNLNKYENEKGFEIFQLLFPYKTSQGLFMLKYAQRKYYKCVFGDYDPSSKEYWDEINRPWDHDHIIPQSWIQNGDWENCQKSWINSMGNIADIPFEKNRSKSDDEDFTYYENEDNSKLLFFNSEIKGITKQSFVQGRGMSEFMNITSKRFVAISSEFLALFNVLQLENNLSEMQTKRKKFLLYQKKEVLKDYDLYYRGNDGKEIPIENVNDIYSWQQPWISLIQRNPDQEQWRRTVAVHQGSTSFMIERGLRNMSMKSASDFIWKEGTGYGRQTFLFEGEEISPLASLLCNGVKLYNEEMRLTNFIETSSSLISYETTICDVKILGTIYSYYGCYYCSIRSKNEKAQLPKIVLDFFDREKGFTDRHNDIYIDCKLSGREPNMKDVCDKFAILMKELEQLNDKCK